MIEIIPMEEQHIDGVLAVEEATFSIPWTRKDFEKEVKENHMAIYYVAVMDGKIVGYAGMWHVVTEGHITNVGVLEEARGHGIGAMLMEKLIEIMSVNPRKRFGLAGGIIEDGAPADLAVLDLDTKWTIDSANFVSKGKATPLDGWDVQGEVVMTIVNGEVVYEKTNA